MSGIFPPTAHSAGGYQIDKSLRFRASASAYLSRTFGTPTSSTIWTWSAWVKRGAITGTYRLFGASTTTYLTFNSSDQLNLTLNGVSAATSTAVFRDPSAWYHIVYQQNGSAQTLYVNNVSVAIGTTSAAIFNTAISHQIGAANTSNYLDGYLSEINFIDGQALTPSSFGEFNSDGVWVPKKYSGTYGNNGFYLPFNDGSSLTTLGYDAAGSNDWTCNNISLTAGTTYDWMTDTPTNNYCVMSPLDHYASQAIPLDGNLKVTTGSNTSCRGTMFVSSGKWYFEQEITAISASCVVGISKATASLGLWVGGDANGYGYSVTGVKWNSSSSATYGASYTTGEVIGVAIDLDNGAVYFSKNGQWANGSGASDQPWATAVAAYSSLSGEFAPAYSVGTNTTSTFNFGQYPMHASSSYDSASGGWWRYPPPTGFKALCTENRPSGGSITTSGSFTGNANADGPFVWLNGNPETMTINGNAVTWGTHADKTAGGFKVRSSSASYNNTGSNTYSVTVTGKLFGDGIHAPNTAKGNL